MDFGMVGLDGLVCSDSGFASTLASDPETKQKWYGSGGLKQERSVTTEDDWRDFKVTKTTDDFSVSKAMLLEQRSPLLRSNSTTLSDGQQMLSFCLPNSQTVTYPYYHHTSSGYSRSTGYGYGVLNAANMQGVLTGVRGPFTPSQWMELEHQALIYKYITANVPIPSNLLIPIRKALESAGLPSFSGLRPNTWEWGSYHMGFSNNNDPEPGRCRRTDGKKWRCSRDAVADQKYCERHMNRGRHRSRKPVEGQTGHSVSGLTTTTTTTTKLMPMTSSSSASVVTGNGATNSLGLSHQHQFSNLQPAAPNSSPSPNLSRSYMNKENMGDRVQNTTGLSMLIPTIGLKENQYSMPKQQYLYGEPRAEFGFVSTDSLLNPLNKSSSLTDCRNYGSSEDLNERVNKSQNLLHQFMDDWPNSQSERSAILWPNIDMQSDRTQLSIAIPMASSDFMSGTSSPTKEKLALSPLRLSRELEPTKRVLGVGMVLNQRQPNWGPISCETSMCGPLGEVLHSTSNSASDCKKASVLNLMTECPSLASSPTGVLQKATFRSLSNSSAGSSPRAENNKTLEVGFSSGIHGSTLMNPSLPAL
ncbi:unnamed protein product [Ilex paraguariensis]|uniref:Growth-regulating factor n=1 Tax=Ilex paraguariensis TaxID=185542 RepID=A0ABC8RXS4_9AQUA